MEEEGDRAHVAAGASASKGKQLVTSGETCGCVQLDGVTRRDRLLDDDEQVPNHGVYRLAREELSNREERGRDRGKAGAGELHINNCT